MPLELEYRAARENAVLIDLSARGKIEVTGTDRVSFLHNILSQDIKTIPTGGCRPAALLSAPAKVLALMNVWKLEDKILLDTDPGFEEKLLGLLEKLIITEEVALRKATHEYAHFQIKGPKAEEMLIGCHFEAAGREISGIFRQRRIRLAVWRTPPSARRNDITLITQKNAGNKIYGLLTQAGIIPSGPETAEILRIEEGLLRYGVDVTEEVSLPETGLDETYASETKGCYPGQEVIARTKTYKGLQRKMTGFLLTSFPPLINVIPAKAGIHVGGKLQRKSISNGSPIKTFGDDKITGSRIYAGEKEIGWITSSCISPAFGGIALGYLTKGFFPVEGGESPVQVEIRTVLGNIPAKTTSLPFVNTAGTGPAKRTCP